jgi:O-antigen/teichoic acid export membrane protein
MLFSFLLRIIFMAGWDSAATYFVASKRFSISEGVIYLFVLGGVGVALAVMAGLFVIRLPLPMFDKAPTAAFQLALVYMATSFFTQTVPNLLIGLGEFTWSTIIGVATYAMNLAAVLLMLWLVGPTVYAALWGTIISTVLGLVVTLIFLRWKFRITFVRPVPKRMWEMLSYGLRHWVGKISNGLNMQIGSVIVAMFASKPEIAFFSMAAGLTSRVQMIPDTLSTTLIPRIAADEKGRPELVTQCARMSLTVTASCLMVLAVFAWPIVYVLFSPKFLAIVPLIRIMAVGILIRCACKVLVPYLANTNHPGQASLAVAIGLVVNLALLWLLMPIMGLMGAAVAMSASYVASSIVIVVCFNRLSGMGIRNIWRFRRSDWGIVKQAFRKFFPGKEPVSADQACDAGAGPEATEAGEQLEPPTEQSPVGPEASTGNP